jgi:hypothetical protein
LRSWILALLMTLSLLPTLEVVEAVVHWVEHGDLAHGGGEEHGSALGADEHGCTGIFHLCACHTASVIAPALQGEMPGPLATAGDECFSPVQRAGLGATAPPIRPPIA